jgi:hypothetical protein
VIPKLVCDASPRKYSTGDKSEKKKRSKLPPPTLASKANPIPQPRKCPPPRSSRRLEHHRAVVGREHIRPHLVEARLQEHLEDSH